MSFRIEEKILIGKNEIIEFKKIYQKKFLKKLYPPRLIKSLYFENSNNDLYKDSVEGTLPRKKIRVRWYNNSNTFSKEIKISSEEGRFKYTELLPSIYGTDDLLGMTMFDNSYGTLSAVMTVSYEREYFLFNNLRITFDSNITYKHLKFVTQPSFNDKECVMEVKVPIDCDDDYIEKIVHQPTSRFSKYSRGMLFVEHKV